MQNALFDFNQYRNPQTYEDAYCELLVDTIFLHANEALANGEVPQKASEWKDDYYDLMDEMGGKFVFNQVAWYAGCARDQAERVLIERENQAELDALEEDIEPLHEELGGIEDAIETINEKKKIKNNDRDTLRVLKGMAKQRRRILDGADGLWARHYRLYRELHPEAGLPA